MTYSFAYTHKRNPKYISIKDANCQNFVSQALRARGWKMNSTWNTRGGWKLTNSWVNVEYFWREIKKKKYANRVDFIGFDSKANRAKVKVGDLVFADWNAKKKSWRKYDHIMMVSKITTDTDGHINIFMVGNTRNQKFRDLDKLSSSPKNFWGNGAKDYITIVNPDFSFVSVK